MSNSRGITQGTQNLDITSNSIPRPEDVQGNIRVLNKLYSYFKSLKCREPSCRYPLSLPAAKDHIKTWLLSTKGPQPAQISGIGGCRKCRRFTCIGCRGKPTLGKRNISTPTAVVNHCCGQGRLFGLWILLSRVDEVELQLQQKCAENVRNNQQYRGSQDTGTGYASGRGSMFGGFGGMGGYDPYGGLGSYGFGGRGGGNWDGNLVSYDQQDDLTDKLFTDLLHLLTAFLPTTNNDSSFDRKPPVEVFSLFRLSLLFDRVTALVRNDSVADMAKRSGLYNAALSFVIAISKHPYLVPLLTEQRPEKKRTPGLQALSLTSNQQYFKFDNSTKGMAASVLSCSNETFKQARVFVSIVSKPGIAKEAQSGSNRELVEICKRIIEFRHAVKQTAPGAIRALDRGSMDPWAEFTAANRVMFTEETLQNHLFYNEFSRLTHSPPGRMTALWKEIAGMTTSLPPGIFLKVSESRLDVMKVLIIGAEGSPYHGGLFIFDMWLPRDWPTAPPKIYSVLDEGLDRRLDISMKTPETGFNPNIHPDGKVCLSLINTWPGEPSEQWQPGRSTLLSVFVSIQAMILGVANPWENEPGRSGRGDSAYQFSSSLRYIKSVQCKTVWYAMLFWITSDQVNTSVWRDVSKSYWRLKGRDVLATVREWAKSNELMSDWLRRTGKGQNGHLLQVLESALGGSNSGNRS